MAITQIIATLPAVLNDSVTFYEDIATRNNTLVTTTFPTINTWATQANDLKEEINTTAAQVAAASVNGGYSQDYINENFISTTDTIATLRTMTTSPNRIGVTGYHTKGDGAFGSNIFEWDDTSVEADNSGTIIKLDSIATGRYKLRYSGAVNVKWFGAAGDGEDNDLPSIENAIDYCDINKKQIEFSDGTYLVNGSLNMARQDLNILLTGKVIFKHANGASGYVIDFNSGASSIYGIKTIGQMQVEAVSSSTGAIRVIACHHSDFNFRALGSPNEAIRVDFAVLSHFNIVVSSNEAPFTIVPTAGLILDSRNAGEYVTDSFFNTIIEGVSGAGLVLTDATANKFIGTSEANGKGVEVAPISNYNTFENYWCEANSAIDFEVNGKGNTFNDCTSLSKSLNMEIITANNTHINGGYYRAINLQSTSKDTLIENINTSDHTSLGIKGPGTYKLINCVKSDVSGITTGFYNDKLGNSGTFTPIVKGITTDGTPTYIRQLGSYYVIGDLVYISIDISVTNFGGTGLYSIFGLPFESSSNSSLAIGAYNNIGLQGSREQLTCDLGLGTNFLLFTSSGYDTATTVGAANLDCVTVGATHSLKISGTYLK